jgi:hypothetical protein
MHHKHVGWMASLAFAGLTGVVLAAERIELNVVERLGVPRAGEPITSGVPLPLGALEDVKACRLLRDGVEVPAQFRAAGLWRPGTSIQWLLVDTQADVAANATAKYVLEYGSGVKAEAAPQAAVVVAEDDTGYTITTGAATFRVNKQRFSLFDEVRSADGRVPVPAPAQDSPRFGATVRGLQAMVTRAIPDPKNTGRSHLIHVAYDGQANADEFTLTFTSNDAYTVVGKAAGDIGGGQYRKDSVLTGGGIQIPADAWLANAQPKSGDRYTFRTVAAGSDAVSEGVFSTRLVESGPLRCVLEVKGCFGPVTAPALEFTARYHFHAGSPRVRLQFTLENNNFAGRTATGNAKSSDIGGVNCVFFDEMALALPTGAGPGRAVRFGLDEAAKSASGGPESGTAAAVELYQDSNGGAQWNRYQNAKYRPRPNSSVTFQGYHILNAGGDVVLAGGRAPGWMTCTGPDCGIAVAVQNFWQQFPKALAVAADGTMKIGLFPARYAANFPFRSGEHKTHEILFDFASDATDPNRREAVAKAFDDPLRLEPTAAWFAKTRALGGLLPEDMEHYAAYEARNLSAIGIFAPGVKPGASIFSRREKTDFYGWMDFGDVPIDFENDSGQWGMKYDLDMQFARQWARTLRPEWWRLFRDASRHHCDIDVHHQPHYPANHYVKGGTWAHSLHSEPGIKNPNRNYNQFTKDLAFGCLAAAARHHLTGDWQARDVVIEQAENALARAMSVQADPGLKNNRLGVRGDACTLNRLMAGYMMTGDERYLERARWTIRDCRYDGKPADSQPVKLWSSAFYMMALARYVEAFPEDAEARQWLLAHLETLRASCWEKDGVFQGFYYIVTPQPDGSIVGEKTSGHYNIMAADALAIAFRLTGDRRFIEAARKCFDYGVTEGPPTYFQIQSANGATHGGFFMAEDVSLRASGK